MNDPDFRLLLDRHLTIFEGYTPEWYMLMPNRQRHTSQNLLQ
jgi:hypothetical protein